MQNSQVSKVWIIFRTHLNSPEMKHLLKYGLYLALMLIITVPAKTQQSAGKLSLEDIFKNGSYPTRYYRFHKVSLA